MLRQFYIIEDDYDVSELIESEFENPYSLFQFKKFNLHSEAMISMLTHMEPDFCIWDINVFDGNIRQAFIKHKFRCKAPSIIVSGESEDEIKKYQEFFLGDIWLMQKPFDQDLVVKLAMQTVYPDLDYVRSQEGIIVPSWSGIGHVSTLKARKTSGD